ncbi:MAG: hypothetical protein WKF71_11865 [Pyrinomonadaceae bacterium]
MKPSAIFTQALKDFVNPRIPPNPGDAIFLASSETLAQMLSAEKCTAKSVRRTSAVS